MQLVFAQGRAHHCRAGGGLLPGTRLCRRTQPLRRASRAAATLPSADAQARRQLAPAAADAPDHGPIAPRPQSRRIDIPQAAATAVAPYLPTASRRDHRSARARPRRNLLTHGASGSPPHGHLLRARPRRNLLTHGTSGSPPQGHRRSARRNLLTHATTRSLTRLTAALARWGPSSPTLLTAALAQWGPSTPPRPPPTPPQFCSSSARSTLFPPALWGSTRLCPARHAPLG